jgi:polysaccharide export outer membrane protein
MRAQLFRNSLRVVLILTFVAVQVFAQTSTTTAEGAKTSPTANAPAATATPSELGATPLAGDAAGATPLPGPDTPKPKPGDQSPAQATTPREPVHADLRYRIGAGDVLEVRVFNRPNLSRDSVRVDASGSIRMPFISTDVKASCQTEAELSRSIANAYSEYLKDPQVDVYIREYNSQPVSLTGAVQKPGGFQLQRQVRLRELLIIAGGPTTSAGQNVQVVHDPASQVCDPEPGERRLLSLSSDLLVYKLDSVMSGDPSMNPFVRPGDFINVPEANQAYVVGNVYKPSTVPLAGNLTISRAIAMAGGTLPNSKGQVRLLRLSPDQNGTREIFLSLKEVQKYTQEDVVLQAGDIVEVQISPWKQAGRVMLASFANAAAASAVYYPLTIIH